MKWEVRRMSIGDIIMDVAVYPDIDVVTDSKLQKLNTYRGSATKSGENFNLKKVAEKRKKKEKNKKTHQR